VKMLTGDHVAIAKEIANQINIGDYIVDSSKILQLKSDLPREFIDSVNGVAQVFPEHKYQIVELLQKAGHVVGMTGDGVNDTPALKKANAGIAVSNATDAAKSAASIVLTHPGLSVILDAVKESRKTFQRMENYSIYRIAETIRILIFNTLAITIFNFFPVSAVMIVILALLNDLPILSIAFDNVKINPKVLHWDMKGVVRLAIFLGLGGVTFSFLLFFLGKVVFLFSTGQLQTLVFLKLTCAGHLCVFLARTGKDHFWAKPFASPILFWATLITMIGGTIFAAEGIFLTSIGWGWSIFVWIFCLGEFFTVDSIRGLYYKYKNNHMKK
jgi:H+-transporting ATPase